MGFQSIDLGMCRGCLWEGDPRSVVIGLPGALTVGAPGLIFSLQAIVQQEPIFDVTHVGEAVAYMAGLPPSANVQSLTVMATKMPFVGRG